MRVNLFEPFPPDEQKRLPVQKAVNRWVQERVGGPTSNIFCLSNYTLNGIDVFLRYHLLKNDIEPHIVFSDYNVVIQTLLDENSSLNRKKFDFVLLSLDLRNLIENFLANTWDVDDIAARLHDLLTLVDHRVHAPVLITDFVLPLTGARRDANSLENKVRRLNEMVAEFAAEHARHFFLIDVNRLIGLLGAEAALDAKLWHQSKAPYKSPLLSWLARDAATIIAAHYGKSKKCVILDCDNTLWGGIIGEDGMDGIALDATAYPGAAFHEFQAYLLGLHSQGVLLAICSKNNEADALQVFAEHPHSLLKREHFACIRINWEDKATNILEIAGTLQLGLNNFVLIDDSNVECALLEQSLPDLTVAQAPQDPADLRHIWNAQNLFFVPQRTEEDRNKLQQYRDNDLRRESAAVIGDMAQFLRSLETKVVICLDEQAQIDRLAQLTQKTNQFNVRTIRYTLPEMEQMLISPCHLVFSMHVVDRFGDLGITNLCILALDGEGGAFVDTFLMSCRVIKRNLEFFFFHRCTQIAHERHGVRTVRAEYVPTAKNGLVAELWDDAGLTLVATQADGSKSYRGELGQLTYQMPDHIQFKEHIHELAY